MILFLGQHIKEFTDFLLKHPDTFRVVDDHVTLVGVENMTDLPVGERLHLPQTNIDTKATQQMLDFFAQCIQIKGPILVDQLFHLVTTQFPQEQWFKMFKTPGDLTTFLRLFSDCFHIQANLVTLLQMPKLSDAHIQQAQAKSREQYNAMNNNNNNHNSSERLQGNMTTTTSSVQQRLRNHNNAINNNNNNNNNSIASPNFKLNAPVSHNSAATTAGGNGNAGGSGSEPNSGFDSYVPMSEMKLENLCERNCPSPSTCSSYGGVTNNAAGQTNNQNAAQVIAPPQTLAPAERNSSNQSLKQRINNLVIRTLAENYEKDKQTMANHSGANSPVHNASTNNGATTQNSNATAANANNTQNSSSHNYFVGDTWKIKVLQNTSVIANIKQSLFVTEAMLKLATNTQSIVISLDCEGINLGVKGEITLIEIGTTRGEAFIFDVRTCPEMITDGGLKTLLEHENVIKVIHDCRNDSVNLYQQFGILLRNVFDTQVSVS